MWRNPSNNYEEYFREHRERESEQWRSQTPMESFDNYAFYQQPPYSQHQAYEDPWFTSMFQQLKEIQRSKNEEMGYVEGYECQQESVDPNLYYHDSCVEDHQEDEEPEDPEVISMLLRVLEDRKKKFEEIGESLNRPALHFDSLKVEGEVVDVLPTDDEIVVEHQNDQIDTRQQSLAEEEVVEIIQLHEDALDEDALALIVAVMNEETLRYNNASTKYETNKEEEEVVQIFELSQKELHRDEVVEPRVPGSPTPLIQHPQGLRKRREWRIKHKWRIKPHNV